MKWISVKNAPPETPEDVLVIGDGWDNMHWYEIGFLEKGVWYNSIGNKMVDSPTHWMPLPSPTKTLQK